jgi:hypothetical protein
MAFKRAILQMRALVETREYEAVMMHFRNAYMARHKQDSK